MQLFFDSLVFNKSSFLYQNKYKKIQIYLSKFNTRTLIINYISKSRSSFLKKDLKLHNFVSGVLFAIFSKNARILTVIFIGYRQLDNTFFFYLPTTAYTTTPFCSSNLLFIQQLLDILYSFKEKKRHYSERNPV
jgi:hypothetical protein